MGEFIDPVPATQSPTSAACLTLGLQIARVQVPKKGFVRGSTVKTVCSS